MWCLDILFTQYRWYLRPPPPPYNEPRRAGTSETLTLYILYVLNGRFHLYLLIRGSVLMQFASLNASKSV